MLQSLKDFFLRQPPVGGPPAVPPSIPETWNAGRRALHGDRYAIGRAGEELVAKHLVSIGFTVLARNFRCAGGELDLVVQFGEVVSFVEIKTRLDPNFNTGEVITHQKIQRIITAAKAFICDRALSMAELACRFDVAIVEDFAGNGQVTYYENAFEGRGAACIF